MIDLSTALNTAVRSDVPLLPLFILLTSLLAAPVLFALPERAARLRTGLNLGVAAMKVALVAWLGIKVSQGVIYDVSFAMLPGLEFKLQADPLAILFISLSAILWLITTVYSVGYLERGPHRARFFGFFSLCVAATVGIAMAGNLFTFLIFYELLTLATYPLVIHRGSAEALRAGRIYLIYTLAGGLVLLLGTLGLWVLAGNTDFTPGGVLDAVVAENRAAAQLLFVVLVGALGVKAALVPLHAWLPIAMVAPAPVSALLHAVAVVKAGAFGIMRVVYEVFGIDTAQALGLTAPLAALAAVTILYGSLRAITQDDIKKRLAYSTVSQVSYITLGVALASPVAAVGALAHLIHQGLMKITMFMAAGNLAEGMGVKRVSQMDGIGRAMPGTMLAFSAAALAMIGLPPLAGFVSKWYLAQGGLDAGAAWVVALLLGSSLLNAVYFLPMLYRAWFRDGSETCATPARPRIGWWLAAPPITTALMVLVVGGFANAPFSPLEWTRFVVAIEYLQE
ncbi:monovalent cation/H+ antiporter subunit D family protein [Rhodobacteraceae bacterium 2376]|uniref:Monovalent cation/H+ antiporter subunit D family protein n=1 Tax=Rhabdonatronobacter sediminivivens TaxID=2743469 RepID=A0A7Z0KZD4_9RHOB|nr:proton-conducting transporter membrane subunit [Rhabdonatronobacter sediminivivens]NYS26105.1 monovalent cation/H+ antiporter subunit D family protein [Rhabdonatronobacter sediminivivens]